MADKPSITAVSKGGLEALEKLDHQTVGLVGIFLLSPMADTWQNDFLPQLRDVLLHRVEWLFTEFDHRVGVTGDKEHWLRQTCAVQEGRQGPVAIDVAIIIEAAGEATAAQYARGSFGRSLFGGRTSLAEFGRRGAGSTAGGTGSSPQQMSDDAKNHRSSQTGTGAGRIRRNSAGLEPRTSFPIVLASRRRQINESEGSDDN
jgi:hypothetical protein